MTMSRTTSAHHHSAIRRVLVVGGTALGAVSVLAGCSGNPTPSLAEFAPEHSVTQVAALPAITPIPCAPTTAAAGETVTRARGDHESGIGAVADYHWSVITGRDPARAADAVAPGADMGRSQNISDALAGFAPGTTYCLRMRQTDPRTVLATLDYQPPAGPAAQYKIRATVTGAPGAVRVSGEVDQ